MVRFKVGDLVFLADNKMPNSICMKSIAGLPPCRTYTIVDTIPSLTRGQVLTLAINGETVAMAYESAVIVPPTLVRVLYGEDVS